MKTFGTILFVAVGLLNVQAAEDARPAEATGAVVVTTDYINQLVAEARTNNPSLKAAGSRIRSAMFNTEAVRTWENPMATFGGSVFSSQGFDPAEQGDLTYGVQQKLPLWGLPKLARNVAQAEASMLSAEETFKIQQMRRDLTKALLDTALAERVVEFDDQDIAWLDATAKAAESKYRAGRSSVADTLEIQNEVAERKDASLTDRHELAHERIALNRLLGRDVNGSWPPLRLPEVALAVPFSDKLVSLALANEPRLKVMEQEIKQAEAKAELTRKSRLPDVSFGVQGRQYSGDGGFREGDFTLQFSLPWFNEGKYHKDYSRDKEQVKAAQQEREDQILMVREAVHHFTVDIEASRREALLYGGEINSRAAQVLSSRLADWEAGGGGLRDVLDARRMVLDSQIKAAHAITEQRHAVADLLLWTGLNTDEALTPLVNEPAIITDHGNH